MRENRTYMRSLVRRRMAGLRRISKVIVKVPDAGKLLVLNVEVPGWMPFAYPVKLETMRDGEVEKTYQFTYPGDAKGPDPSSWNDRTQDKQLVHSGENHWIQRRAAVVLSPRR